MVILLLCPGLHKQFYCPQKSSCERNITHKYFLQKTCKTSKMWRWFLVEMLKENKLVPSEKDGACVENTASLFWLRSKSFVIRQISLATIGKYIFGWDPSNFRQILEKMYKVQKIYFRKVKLIDFREQLFLGIQLHPVVEKSGESRGRL